MSPKQLWRQWRHRRRFEAELDEELRFHLDCRTDSLIREGIDRREASRRARIELGMVELHKDGVRSASGLDAVDAVSGDLIRTLRSLLRAPLYFAGALVVLALAVALNLVMFALHQTYLGAPPDTAKPGALFDLDLRTATADRAPWLTLEEVDSLRQALGPDVRHVAFARQVSLGFGGDPPRAVQGMAVNAEYFELLAADPEMGVQRGFEDHRDGAHRIVLSHAAWVSLADSDPFAVGANLVLGGEAWTIAAVMPRDFAGLEPFRPQFWVGARAHEDWRHRHDTDAGPARYAVSLQSVEGAVIAGIEQRALSVLARLPSRATDEDRIAAVRLLPRTAQLSVAESEDAALLLLPIYGLLLLVLLVACANLANLMLARTLARRRELAVRSGIGATRLRLMGLLMLEAAVLASLGALLGALLAWIFADIVHGYAASVMASVGMQPLEVELTPAMLPAALGLAALATLAVGLIPALAATAQDRAHGTRGPVGGIDGRLRPARLRGVLVVAQIAASATLLMIGVFAVQLAQRTGTLDAGYPVQALIDLRHPAPDRAVLNEALRLPGVLDAAAIAPVPLYGPTWRVEVLVDAVTRTLAVHYADQRVARVFDMPMLAGRWFSEQEARAAEPVVVVGAATAAHLWPGRTPLGQRILLPKGETENASGLVEHEVIGVVSEIATGLLISGIDRSALWLPGHAESPSRPLRDHVLRVEPSESAALLVELARVCLRQPFPQPCTPWRLSEIAAWQRLPLEIARSFALGIGLMALVISAAGLWGGVAYTVVARTHEIGVRRALGAQHADLQRLVLEATLRQLVLGLGLAAPVCGALAVGASNLLDGVASTALWAFSGVAVSLAMTALLATAIPARRAIAIAPTQALREA